MSVNRDARTFRLKDVERGTVRIKVTRNTRFERIDGLSGLKVGAKNIEATVKRKNGVWVALEVERSGGGGEGGERRDGGDDTGAEMPATGGAPRQGRRQSASAPSGTARPGRPSP